MGDLVLSAPQLHRGARRHVRGWELEVGVAVEKREVGGGRACAARIVDTDFE